MLILSFVAAFAQTTPPPPAAAPPPAPAPGAPPTDAVIRAEVDRVYGKHVPEAAVCIERPTFAAPFHGSPTPVGTKRGARGCVLLGVMVEGAWLEPAQALPAAVDRAAWDGLTAADRTAAILRWTDDVLLAFDLPSATVPGKVVLGSKGFTTERRMFRRADRTGGVSDLTEKSTFDPGLVRTATTEQVHAGFTSSLLTRPDKVQGLSQAVVDQALTSKGGLIQACFTDAWEADPTVVGRVALSWTVTAGKVDPVAVIEQPGEPTNEALAKCFARHVRAAVYPADASGTASWVFWIDRRAITP